jgi:hypothetical protein
MALPLATLSDRWRSNGSIGENGADPVGHGFEQVLQKPPSSLSISRFNELGDRELGCPVDANEKIQLPLGGLYLGNVPSRADSDAAPSLSGAGSKPALRRGSRPAAKAC